MGRATGALCFRARVAGRSRFVTLATGTFLSPDLVGVRMATSRFCCCSLRVIPSRASLMLLFRLDFKGFIGAEISTT